MGFFAHTVLAADCSGPSSGDDLDTLKAKEQECRKLLQMSVDATKPSAEKMAELEKNIAAIDANVQSLSDQIDKKKKDIAANETKLGDKMTLMDAQVRDFYKNDYQSEWEYFLITVLSGNNVSETVQLLGYRQVLIDQQKKVITSIVLQVNDLAAAKKKLESTQDWLTAEKASLEVTLAPIRDLVKRATDYQATLSATAGALSARQQELLAEKTGNFSTSVGDVPPADDPASRPDFSPGFSPAFAGFSFGAPHRKGMSQYGAYGRAKSGQSAEDILHAYYGGGMEIKTDYSRDVRIHVVGNGIDWSGSIEDYVKRIYEMPGSWTDNDSAALKAQAVAARSYALAYTNNGANTICPTEACQVFQTNPKGGAWDDAVNKTAGWVLIGNGKPLSAWYAASAGGYTYSYTANGYSTPGEWDTKCGSQGCWTGDAYEKIAGSPWFYKAWYRPRYGGATRSHPWLTKDEFADIVNAVQLYEKDNGTLSHLSQTDKSNPDTWSRDQVRSELSNRGGSPIDSVDSVNVTYSTGGYTSKVTINGRDFDGGDFRQIFNIRAPGEIWLASALFDIRQK